MPFPPASAQPPPGDPGQSVPPDAEQAEPEPEEQPLSTQLRLSDGELKALKLRIKEDEQGARAAMQELYRRFANQEADWRRKVGLFGGAQGESNFRVPLTTALLMAKHARETDAVFGNNPGVDATPVGPTDAKVSKRISLFMKWMLYENMQALKPISLWMLRRLQHGRSFAYVPWERKYFTRRKGGKKERVLYREGPVVYPIHPDDLILPPTTEGKSGFDSVQNAEFVGRRYWTTPTEMLLAEGKPGEPMVNEGDWYQGVSSEENWEKIVRFSRRHEQRDEERDSVRLESDRAEGVDRDWGGPTGRRIGQVEVWEWHMKWRRWADGGNEERGTRNDESASDGNGDPRESRRLSGRDSGTAMADDAKPAEGAEYRAAGGEAAELADAGTSYGRLYDDGTFVDQDGVRKERIESNLIVRYCPSLGMIVGVQDADEVYPDTWMKRPILELALLNDGQYWSQSLIELSEEIEAEMTALANQVIQASDMSIGPPVFYDPAIGDDAVSRKYEKFDMIPCKGPSGIKQLDIRPNLEAFPMLWQMFQSIYEQLTGITNFVMGRSMDQPNAPKTLGGQRLVMGAGDVRLALDMRMLGEDLKSLLDWVWSLTTMFGSEEMFYRVAEGDARDLFEHSELDNGFAKLSDKEREGRYDFGLNFSDDAQVKEGKKQEAIALVQALMTTALGQTDIVAQYRALVDLYETFGKDFTQIAKEPPPPQNPMTSDQIWAMLLEGEEVHPNPADDDLRISADLSRRVDAMWQGREEDRDMDAMFKATLLIGEYNQAAVEKQRAQAMAQMIAGALAKAQMAEGQPPDAGDPMQQIGGAQGGQPPTQGGMGA